MTPPGNFNKGMTDCPEKTSDSPGALLSMKAVPESSRVQLSRQTKEICLPHTTTSPLTGSAKLLPLGHYFGVSSLPLKTCMDI